MYKLTLSTLFIMFSLFAKGQSTLEKQFEEAKSAMRYPTIYNRVIWDLRPTNGYQFDQNKGELRYQTDDPSIYAIVKPALLGTFNLDDKTFLWADKNSSIEHKLSDKVDPFRKELPKKYQKDKFATTTGFISNLQALFASKLHANGFDSKRQGSTILYYVLLNIEVYENEKLKHSIDLNPHFEFVENNAAIQTIKKMHNEMVEVNDRYHNKKDLPTAEAFKAIQDVHLQYWLNEDKYYFPSLSWPCDYAENATSDWKVIRFKESNRVFVVYTSDKGWTTEPYAYEIDQQAKGQKRIVGKY